MPENVRLLTVAEALLEGTRQVMAEDERVIVIGEGVPDPKGIFGTTLGLRGEFGVDRVFDMPVAENGMTGVVIGAALAGMRPILTHQRLDFSLYSLDQIINNAAKWHFMFGGQSSVPIVIRMMIGRGWGQGAQHSQNLQALFAHIPGLKVVMPATASDAKGLLVASVRDNNPVIFLEHRWVHGLRGEVEEDLYEVELGKAHVLRKGSDITIVSSSYMTVEGLRAAEVVSGLGVSAEVVDLRTIRPLDMETIIGSVRKTGRLLVVDSGWMTGGLPGEIIMRVLEAEVDLTINPRRVSLPDMPTPTSPALTKGFYKTYKDVVATVCNMMNKDPGAFEAAWDQEEVAHDVPGASFIGPF